jgi:type III pantothenate kinase
VTPDVVVDIGNSRVKWGRCEHGRVAEMASLPGDSPEEWNRQAAAWNLAPGQTWAVASVRPQWEEAFAHWVTSRDGRVVVVNRERIPLALDVDEPDKVGIDRLLNAIAASRRVPPGTPAVAVSVGSAVTVDLIDAGGVFRGGAIFPGPWMMARALHEFTAALPLVDPKPIDVERTVGRNTREAIESGIHNAVDGAVDVILWNISREATVPLAIFVTGGGLGFLRGIHNAVEDLYDLEYDPLLTLDGLRLAAEALP